MSIIPHYGLKDPPSIKNEEAEYGAWNYMPVVRVISNGHSKNTKKNTATNE